VIITESEFKALAALQAYDAGLLDAPTIGQPGLTVFREAWAAQLRAQGVNEVVLCYDSQPRTVKGGVPLLTPEEQWCLRHGGVCAAAGLQVRIARLPLRPGQEKEEIDTYLPREGATRFQRLIDQAPLLDEYHRSISSAMLDHHHLPVPSSYPVRRPRPTRLVLAETPQAYDRTPIQIQAESATLAETRAAIVTSTAAHAATGTGFLVLAHPPGTGKGHNTTLGLQQWMGMGTGMGTEIAMERGMEHPAAVAQGAKPAGTTSATAKTTSGEQHGNGDGAGGHSGFLVWTALRKEQIQDQQGIPLIPLAGRNAGNCRKLPEAIVLAQKGYSVKDALCQRRCPHVQQCSYLKQFAQEGHFFASTPLLKATGWWEQAGALVLDEFDPASLIQHVHLSAADLALMSRSHGQKPAIQTMLRWIAQTLASTTDRTLGGMLFIEELARQAALDGADLATCLRTALEELPTDEELNRLVGLPSGATLAEYQQLPPSHTARLLRQIDKEVRSQMMGRRQTSRLEARSGSLELSLRVEHLIEQLARPEQPKIILDATANAGLLRAIFPNTPVTVEQTSIRGALRIVQVVGRDWAKSTLVKRHRHRPRHEQRRTQWFDEVASALRPGRPTLVVCTRECAEELREGLQARGFPSPDVVVDHYGGLRGSNAYKGYDVILAQVYHPNLDAIVREGRALFADDLEPLDTRMTVSNRLLRDGTGATWNIPVPTFADVRLAALLENRREAEMLQCALRGRPLDHPESQITLLFSLPIPGLSPTIIVEAKVSAGSNGGREQAVKARLCAAAQQLIEQGKRVLDVTMLARAAEVSVVTVRKHWAHIAARLHLTMQQRRRQVVMPRGGVRHYERQVLVRRGRMVRRSGKEAVHHVGERRIACSTEREEGALDACTMDQADKRNFMTRVIHHHQPVRGRRRSVGRTKRVGDGAEWRWMWRVRQRDRLNGVQQGGQHDPPRGGRGNNDEVAASHLSAEDERG